APQSAEQTNHQRGRRRGRLGAHEVGGPGMNPPTSVRDSFVFYLQCGLNPLPGWPRSKATVHDGEGIYSTKASIEMLDAWFPEGEARNSGVVNGRWSGNNADIDAACAEAVELAPKILPATTWRFGRKGARDSKHFEFATDVPFPHAHRKFLDPLFPGD